MNHFAERFRSAVPNRTARIFLMFLAGVFALELATGIVSRLVSSYPVGYSPQPRGGASADASAETDPDAAVVPFPQHASARYLAELHADQMTAELVMQAPVDPGIRNVVKIEDWTSRQAIVLVYVEPGRQIRMNLPPSRYRVKVARGRQWQGDDELFGRDTRMYATMSPVDLVSKPDRPQPSAKLAIQSMVDGSTRSIGIRKEQF